MSKLTHGKIYISTIMKNSKWFICMLCVALCALTACKDKGNEPSSSTSQPQQSSIYGNVSKPAWEVPSTHDYTSSMTPVIKVVIVDEQLSNADDLLAAFIGDQCCGIGELIQNGLYNLYISGSEGNVTLRYWSSKYTNIFEAKDDFPFVNNAPKGTPDKPYVPTFKVANN